ncbi:hypothetical protein A3F02_03260 [Candidatus Curtissbacteria bacterium RIFCSPHIGHO2_12_FULL_38_9b]|uniref:Uncharacterized protein n=2 Tax=Candidatus Curtissiibacteriota TaxID=1752717 RepID=A0A1F5GXK4_9BACT|nr:MAG: hypothetical protein A3A48_02425 [Candidatus Curtissbacteria bacterium RIFCSPLOWO2_01_FULL_37_9]OGD96601.1 MAG: hypothetical protein A3F02_03260 [Candidatus Curtissbacteria bacterium RIFCSPHIGHO2_12_FULL_38_9b]
MPTFKDKLGLSKFPHYYGDVGRLFFLLGGVVMLFSLPLLNQMMPVPAYVSILIIVAVVFVAGITNPAQKWVHILDSVISLVGIILFEYLAILVYTQGNEFFTFLLNQTLAAIFLFAFYFSVKTVRGFVVPERKSDKSPR